MSKKTSRGAASTASSATKKSQKSSISKSAFSPPHLQVSLFASVVQGFESQHLRIHDTSTGRLRCEHAAAARTRVTSLAWGYYGTSYRDSQQESSKKKRKRDQDAGGNVVVAYGLDNSDVCIFSPAEGKIVCVLSGVHEQGIKDFQFVVEDQSQGWSIGGDGNLVQWDLTINKATRTISLPDTSISTLALPSTKAPQILCASSTPYTVSFHENRQPKFNHFDSFKNQIHTLFRSTIDESHPSEHFLAADNDRYINVYDIALKRLTKTLVAGSEVDSADFYSPPAGTKRVLSEQLLAVVTREGLVEFFPRPFIKKNAVNGDLKAKRKSLTSKAAAKVKLVSAGTTKAIPIFNASLQGPDLVVATAEGGIDVTFQKIRWQDEGNGELLFDGIKEFKHSKTASTLNTATLNGAKDMGKSHVDESKTVVINGEAHGSSQNAAIEIGSSDDDNHTSEADSEDEEVPVEGAKLAQEQAELEESDADSDKAMKDATNMPAGLEDEDMAEDQPEEPSFGELLARKHRGTISVADALHPESPTLVQVEENKAMLIPSGVSLSTVLTQALRTNDQTLLESCLHNAETDIIKNTIQRLDSSLAGILLQKLAERLSSRPGRYGHLLLWVQWTCIVHGGAVAGRPEVFSKIETLYGVLSQRAKSLDSLLLLKGKLDMLDAQLAFRRDIQSRRGARHGREEANVIYVDEDDNWSSDDDEAMDALPALSRSKKPKKALEQLVQDSDSEDSSDDDEEMPAITNGIGSGSEEESDDDESEFEADIPMQKSKAKPAKKLDAIIDDEADESHPSDEESASSDEDEDSDEEADSELDDFINDDSIEEEVVEDDVMIEGDGSDDEPKEVVQKPKKKKAKRA